MNQYIGFTNKIGMTIFDLKVKDFNWLVKLKEIYALNNCGIPILGVNDITGI